MTARVKFTAARVGTFVEAYWRAEGRDWLGLVWSCLHKHRRRDQAERCASLEADEWQDESRTYTPEERQLDVRIDFRSGPGGAGPLAHPEAS